MNQSQSKLSKYFKFVFPILSLIHISQAIIPLFLTGGSNEGDGVNIANLDLSIDAKISIATYVVVFVLLAMRRRTLTVLCHNIFLGVLIAIVSFAYFWSIDRKQTWRFIIYAIATTGLGLYIASSLVIAQSNDRAIAK